MIVLSDAELLRCNIVCVLADMIYEDVQRDSRPLDRDNGWSSSEFESYDEQSDNETKLPTRSKVVLVSLWMHVYSSHYHLGLSYMASCTEQTEMLI